MPDTRTHSRGGTVSPGSAGGGADQGEAHAGGSALSSDRGGANGAAAVARGGRRVASSKVRVRLMHFVGS